MKKNIKSFIFDEKGNLFYLISYTANSVMVVCFHIYVEIIFYFKATLRHEKCFSGSRLDFLWHDELKRRGRDRASLTRVFWRFCQTRMLVAIFSLLLTMVAGFVGPVSTVQILLPLYVQQIPVMGLSAWSHTRESQVCLCILESTLSCFTLVLEIEMTSYWEITKPQIANTINTLD